MPRESLDGNRLRGRSHAAFPIDEEIRQRFDHFYGPEGESGGGFVGLGLWVVDDTSGFDRVDVEAIDDPVDATADAELVVVGPFGDARQGEM